MKINKTEKLEFIDFMLAVLIACIAGGLIFGIAAIALVPLTFIFIALVVRRWFL